MCIACRWIAGGFARISLGLGLKSTTRSKTLQAVRTRSITRPLWSLPSPVVRRRPRCRQRHVTEGRVLARLALHLKREAVLVLERPRLALAEEGGEQGVVAGLE